MVQIRLANRPNLMIIPERQEFLHSIFLKFIKITRIPMPIEWQWHFLTLFFDNLSMHLANAETDFLDQYALCGAFGTGKTSVAIWALVWLMLFIDFYYKERFQFKGVVISGTERQLHTVFWESLKFVVDTTWCSEYFTIGERKISLKNRPEIFVIPAVCNKNNINSLFGVHGQFVVALLEEANATLRETILGIRKYFASVNQNSCGAIIMTSNPTVRNSYFYDVMESEEKGADWNRFRITRADVVDDIETDRFTNEIIKDYGVDSDEYRIGVLGEHGYCDVDTFIPEYVIMAHKERAVFSTHDRPIVIGVDVASGEGACFSAMYVKSMNYVLEIYNEKKEITPFEEDIKTFIDNYLPMYVVIDPIGMGKGTGQRITRWVAEKYGDKITVLGFQSKKIKYRFGDERTMAAHNLKEWMHRFGGINPKLQHAEELFRQMRVLKADTDSRGLYTLLPKDKTELQDIVDAAIMAHYVEVAATPATILKPLPLLSRNNINNPGRTIIRI